MITLQEQVRIDYIVAGHGGKLINWDFGNRTFNIEIDSNRGFAAYYSFISNYTYQYDIDSDRRFSFQIQEFAGFDALYFRVPAYFNIGNSSASGSLPKDHIKFLKAGIGVIWSTRDKQRVANDCLMLSAKKNLLIQLFLGTNNLYLTDLYMLLICGNKYTCKRCLKDYDEKDKRPKHKSKFGPNNSFQQQYTGKNGMGYLRDNNNYFKPKPSNALLRKPIKF